jgi:predicted Zn-dependent peptidase
MPGLLRGMARTAVIAGTATAVSNRVSRRQAERWSQDQQEAPQQEPVAEQTQDDVYVELEKLGQLKEQGILTQEEFDAKKKQLLGL